MYLNASPLYVLTAQSRDKGSALEALNFLYRETKIKAAELGVSVKLDSARLQIA